MEKMIGKRKFGSKIDITDPCYNRDVWCRMNDVGIVPGEYECYIETKSNEETGGWGERVSKIGICLIGKAQGEYKYIGDIGVDTALAGFFNHKPDYSGDDWMDFCRSLNSNDIRVMAWMKDDGFFSRTGYGDGGYEVFATGGAGKYTGLYIEFIGDDDEDEDEYDDYDDYEEYEEDEE